MRGGGGGGRRSTSDADSTWNDPFHRFIDDGNSPGSSLEEGNVFLMMLLFVVRNAHKGCCCFCWRMVVVFQFK